MSCSLKNYNHSFFKFHQCFAATIRIRLFEDSVKNQNLKSVNVKSSAK